MLPFLRITLFMYRTFCDRTSLCIVLAVPNFLLPLRLVRPYRLH